MHSNRGSSRSVRVGVWVLGLAVVPLAGAGWFAAGEVDDVRDARDQATHVRAAAEELTHTAELQSELLDEGLFASILTGIEDLGVDPSIGVELLGIDTRAELAASQDRVDRMIRRLGDDVVEAEVAEVRQHRGLTAIRTSDRYEDITRDVGQRTDAILEELYLTASRSSEETSGLVASLRTLDHATHARKGIAELFLGHFGIRYSERAEAIEEIEEVIVATSNYDDAAGHLRRDTSTSEAVRRQLAAIHASPAYATLRQSVDEAVTGMLEGAIDPDPSMGTILLDLTKVAEQYSSGAETAQDHLDLLITASDQVVDEARALDTAADARTRSAALTIAVLVLITLGFALGVSAFIGRPLRKLAESVRRLTTGDLTAKLRPTGPTEIREATQALNEARDNLQWAERQATALATGRLDDPSLEEQAPGTFGASLQDAVATLTRSLAEREEFRRRLSHEANHDSLTQVANRRSVMANLERSLARTRRGSTQLAVMFIDLDGFKAVNDLEGHPVGDLVLAAVARRLVTSVRRGDQVGRVGGDEFVVVAEPVDGVEEALALARRVREHVCAPINTGDVSVSVDASIGIAIIDADCDLSADEVLRDADLAVYKAKARGRGQIVVCDEELRAELEQRADMEHALRAAIARDELVVHYQPIVAADGREVLALEALVRWNRPDKGLVPPDHFIPHAERSELIVDVDRWVVEAAARQMREWADHPALCDMPVAVNISARHLGRSDFVEGILGILAAHDVSGDRLIVEVTESAVVHDLDHAGWSLQELRNRGVQVAIDDFGTGYTSLAHLRALPIDILKIDRSFTSDPSSASLVQLIIDTGHLLGARITSEGIETDEQGAALSGMGSDELQGFLYGRPVPAAQLEADHTVSTR